MQFILFQNYKINVGHLGAIFTNDTYNEVKDWYKGFIFNKEFFSKKNNLETVE